MKIQELRKQIEIRFWVLWVRLLKSETALYILGAVSVVLIMTMLGLVALLFARLYFVQISPRYIWWPGDGNPSVQEADFPIPANGQENILLVLVDQLENERPVLRAVWLAVIHPSGLQAVFLPIYPVANDPAGSADLEVSARAANTDLAGTFSLQADRSPAPLFLQMLRRRQIWWGHYLVIDEAALSRMYALSVKVNDPSHHFDNLMVTHLPLQWDDPHLALAGQVKLLNQVCSRANTVAQAMLVDQALDLMSGDYSTDLSNEQIERAWGFLERSSVELQCEFPTFSNPVLTVKRGD